MNDPFFADNDLGFSFICEEFGQKHSLTPAPPDPSSPLLFVLDG